MDEFAITRRPVRKRARIGNKCDVEVEAPVRSVELASLPEEIILEIFSYLSSKDLAAVQNVSTYFRWLGWKARRFYNVTDDELNIFCVIDNLKKMRILRRFQMKYVIDCDNILRQLSLTNTKLEELIIIKCTGTTSKLYLRPDHLNRILQRCRNLHTIKIRGSRLRGKKFFRLLGGLGSRARQIIVSATRSQFCTLIQHSLQIHENDRDLICATFCGTFRGTQSWSPFIYKFRKQMNGLLLARIKYNKKDALVQINLSAQTTPEINPRNSQDPFPRTTLLDHAPRFPLQFL